MKILKKRLLEASKQQNIDFGIIEQDYMLSWILYGIASHPILSKILVFKGGTALKKCYFGEYRFSQDLDFTLISKMENKVLDLYVKESCALAENYLQNYGEISKIECNIYQEDSPHPFDQRAYVILTSLAWHKRPMIKVMIEITRDELVINPAKIKQIIYTYGEILDAKLQVYCLEEIIMEKLRAILQQIIKLHERGWGRSRARDFYDIWMIYNKYQDSIDNNIIRNSIHKKFKIKNVEFKSIEDFFNKRYIDEVVKTWDQWLKSFVSNLPPAEIVLNDVKNNILPKIFLTDNIHNIEK